MITIVVVALPSGFYGLMRHRMARRMAAMVEELRAEGWPVTFAELDAYYAYPAGANAAVLYEQAFQLLKEADEETAEPKEGKGFRHGLPFPSDAELPPPGKPLAEAMMTTIRDYLSHRSEAIEILHQAAIVKDCRYSVNFAQGVFGPEGGYDLSLLLWPSQSAEVLALDAVMKAVDGDTGGVLQDMRSISALADSLESAPSLISSVRRLVVLRIDYQLIQRCLPRVTFTDEQLRELADVFPEVRAPDVFRHSVAGELCVGLSAFADLKQALRESERGLKMPWASYAIYRIYRSPERDMHAYVGVMKELLRAGDMPIGTWEAHADSVEQRITDLRVWDRTGWSPLHTIDGMGFDRGKMPVCRLTLPSSTFLAMHLVAEAHVRLVAVGIALERHRLKHGTYPGHLRDLVPADMEEIPTDLFSASPVRYQATVKGFLVYSVGRDGKDDGGDRTGGETWYGSGPKDIVFRVAR